MASEFFAYWKSAARIRRLPGTGRIRVGQVTGKTPTDYQITRDGYKSPLPRVRPK